MRPPKTPTSGARKLNHVPQQSRDLRDGPKHVSNDGARRLPRQLSILLGYDLERRVDDHASRGLGRRVAHVVAILAARCDPSSPRPSRCGFCANPERPEHRFWIAIDHRE